MKTYDSITYPDWVNAQKHEVHQSLYAQVYEFDRNVGTTVNYNALNGMSTYLNRGLMNTSSTGYMNRDVPNSTSANFTRLNFNITAAIIDTLTAKLASIQAVPQAVTSKGNAKGRKLAEDLNHLLKGIFHKYDVSHKINLAYRDAMISNAGYLKVIKENGDIRIDRVRVDEIIVDTADGFYNEPYKMIHRKSIPVAVMVEKYPKFKMQIETCPTQVVSEATQRNYTPMIVVLESWCKNTYKEKGRHVICIENVDLVDEEWNKDYFPVLKCDYNEPIIGWLGQSVVDELNSIQAEIDRILITMQSIMKIISVPRIFYDNNSNINLNHITNQLGACIGFDGKNGIAPIIHNGAGMPPELPTQLQSLIAKAYERVGLTPMDTQGMQKTGTGNQSGEALKTMTDIKSERWQLLQRNYEHSHVQFADIILKELQGTNLKISALDRNIGLKEIRTKVIPNVCDSYTLKIFPVSSLPSSIPDLIDSVEKMRDLGVIQPSQIPELFKMPDLDTFTAFQSAPRRLIDKKLENMLDGGVYWNPEPYYDLDYALTAALQQYNHGQLNDESDKRLSLLRRFIDDVKSLKDQAMQANQPSVPQQQPQQQIQQPVQQSPIGEPIQ